MTLVLRFDPARVDELRAFLAAGAFKFERRSNALFLAKREGVTLTAYASGKLLITGVQDAEYGGVLVGRGFAQGEIAAPLAPQVGGVALTFDGLCDPFNPGGVATFGFVVTRDGREIHAGHGLAAPPGPRSTNNVAEYAGLIAGLRWLIEQGLTNEPVRVRGDSQLIIKQTKGEWAVSMPHLKPMNEDARALLARLPLATLEWVRREENERADELSRVGYAEALRAHPEWRDIRPPSAADKPASPRQIAYMRDLGIEPPPGVTSREASKLIDDALKARRGVR